MLNKVFELTEPRQIVPVYKNIDMDDTHLIVRPTRLSICHADMRYYMGTRPKAVLKKKLPMALIHEAIGRVEYDPTGTFRKGDDVVLIPNTPCEQDPFIAENYLRSSVFRASSCDGFMQEHVSMNPDRVLPLPDGIDPSVAAFTEIVSVSFHGISRLKAFSHERHDAIGVWGDGNLGYITGLLIRYMFPEAKLYIFGTSEFKLQDFAFADGTFLTDSIPQDMELDHCIECVGGVNASAAINQIINTCIRPEGTISLLGVSEEPVPINTRMVLEKGLRLFGSSRSGRVDFAGLLALYRKHPELMNYLQKIVGMSFAVRDTRDMTEAFEADLHKSMGKTIMVWEV